jgi:hypothetical protein
MTVGPSSASGEVSLPASTMTEASLPPSLRAVPGLELLHADMATLVIARARKRRCLVVTAPE